MMARMRVGVFAWVVLGLVILVFIGGATWFFVRSQRVQTSPGLPKATAQPIVANGFADISNFDPKRLEFRVVELSVKLGPMVVWHGVTGVLTLVSKQEIEPGIIEYVFVRKNHNGENRFRIREVIAGPTVDWLKFTQKNQGPTEKGKVSGVSFMGLVNRPSQEDLQSFPERYRNIFIPLKVVSIQVVKQYFEQGIIPPDWTGDSNGIIDLTKALVTIGVEQ